MAQLHKKFTDSQVKEMLQRYLNSETNGVRRNNHINVVGRLDIGYYLYLFLNANHGDSCQRP